MEYKCPICGKTYTTEDDMADCVAACNKLHRAQRKANEREENIKRMKELDDQIKFHGHECAKAMIERYQKEPDAAQRVYVFEIVCPDIGWIEFNPASIANLLHM